MEKGRKILARALGLGAAASLAVYLLLLALAAYGTVNGRMGEELTPRAVWLCALSASFAGACIAGRGRTAGVPLLPLLSAAVFWACVAGLGVLAADEPDPRRMAELLAAALLGGAAAQLLLRRKGGRRKRRRGPTHSRR